MGCLKQESTKSPASWRNEDVRSATAHKPFMLGTLVPSSGRSYIQWIEKDEWGRILKVFCAMCEAYKKSPTEMFQQTVPKDTLQNVS